MNYRDRSPLDAGHWTFFGLQRASWDNRSLSARNIFNPIDHPWKFDSKAVAHHRLLAITRSDRAACGDGRWVKVRDSFCFETEGRWGRLIFTGCKPHYRWERRL